MDRFAQPHRRALDRGGVLKPVDPETLFFMIWATTQHYADFAHQINTLNGGMPLSESAFEAAKSQVAATIVSGVLAARPAPDRP